MVANVSPAQSEWEESLSTLRFAESVKKVKTKPQVVELAPEEPELMLESFRSEIDILREALVMEGTRCPSHSSQVAREVEASEYLRNSFSARAGHKWAQAVEQTRVLEGVQRQLLQAMSLPVEEVGQLVGVDSGTPYLLNISDDPALSGCLLYFLRPEPELSQVGQDVSNNIQLRGLCIPARLCEIRYNNTSLEEKWVSICKVCEEDDKGRLLVNGRPLRTGVPTALPHGSRVVFGWAFCFRLVISGRPSEERAGECFDVVSREVLEYSMSNSEMGVMRATAHWQGELMRRNLPGDEVERILRSLGEIYAQLEEANALCCEVLDSVPSAIPVELDLGIIFSYMNSHRPPNVVVQVWKRGEGQLLSIWPAADFDRRLDGLRDVHREAMTVEGGSRWALRLSSEEWWAGDAGTSMAESKEVAASPPLSDTEDGAPSAQETGESLHRF